jgi:hypothetical protein
MKFSLAILAIVFYNQAQAQENCCDVIELAADGKATDGSWTITPTLWSPYEVTMSATQYCDFVEIRSADVGTTYTVLGKRTFDSPHPEEQPFSRAIRDIILPDGTNTITAVGHDSVNGYCGETLTLTLVGDAPTVISATPETLSSGVPVSTILMTLPPASLPPGSSSPASLPPGSLSPASMAPILIGDPQFSELPSSIPSSVPSSNSLLISSTIPSSTPSSIPSAISPELSPTAVLGNPTGYPSSTPSDTPSVMGLSGDESEFQKPTSYAVRASIGALAFVAISSLSLLL